MAPAYDACQLSWNVFLELRAASIAEDLIHTRFSWLVAIDAAAATAGVAPIIFFCLHFVFNFTNNTRYTSSSPLPKNNDGIFNWFFYSFYSSTLLVCRFIINTSIDRSIFGVGIVWFWTLPFYRCLFAVDCFGGLLIVVLTYSSTWYSTTTTSSYRILSRSGDSSCQRKSQKDEYR